MPKYKVGERFQHDKSGRIFRIYKVGVLAPEGRIGYKLSSESDGWEIRRFEGELDRDFKVMKQES